MVLSEAISIAFFAHPRRISGVENSAYRLRSGGCEQRHPPYRRADHASPIHRCTPRPAVIRSRFVPSDLWRQQLLNFCNSLQLAAGPVSSNFYERLPMTPEPASAGFVKSPSLGGVRLAALAVRMPFGTVRREQQMEVVTAREQFVLQPCRAVAEQRLAPKHVAQQMCIEDQQLRSLAARGVFPGQLATGDGGNVSQAGVALFAVDEMPDVFAHHQPAEALLHACGQPAFAGRFGPGEHQHLQRDAPLACRRAVARTKRNRAAWAIALFMNEALLSALAVVQSTPTNPPVWCCHRRA